MGSLTNTLPAVLVGGVAGLLATGVQTAVGLVLQSTLLPRGEDVNIAPRLIDRLTLLNGHRRSKAADWALGTLFHLGYGAGWGALFGLGRHMLKGSSPALAASLGGLIYAMAFSEIGVGTRVGVEQPPNLRRRRKQFALVAVVASYCAALPPLCAAVERLVRSLPDSLRDTRQPAGYSTRTGVTYW